MNLLKALVRWVALETSQEIAQRDREIEKLRTALASAQEGNRALWDMVKRQRDVEREEH